MYVFVYVLATPVDSHVNPGVMGQLLRLNPPITNDKILETQRIYILYLLSTNLNNF